MHPCHVSCLSLPFIIGLILFGKSKSICRQDIYSSGFLFFVFPSTVNPLHLLLPPSLCPISPNHKHLSTLAWFLALGSHYRSSWLCCLCYWFNIHCICASTDQNSCTHSDIYKKKKKKTKNKDNHFTFFYVNHAQSHTAYITLKTTFVVNINILNCFLTIDIEEQSTGGL